MKRLGLVVFLLLLSICLPLAGVGSAKRAKPAARSDAWTNLPFTAREWARQTLLPYRKIPLKNGGSMSVQEAYDLYLNAGQPPYPDMSTPGLVTDEEVREQMRLSQKLHKS